jgi:hypothetical protein
MANFDKCLACRHVGRNFTVIAVCSYNQNYAVPFG